MDASEPGLPLETKHGVNGRRLVGGWAAVALAVATTLACGLAGWGGLAFFTDQSHIAILWPASGIAAGLAIAVGPSGFAPIAAGVAVATVAVYLGFGHPLFRAIAFAMLAVAEALFVAWFIAVCSQTSRRSWRLVRVFNFYAAAAIGSTISSLGAAILLHYGPSADTTVLELWRDGSLRNFVGIVVVAPSVVTIVHLVLWSSLKGYDWKLDVVLLIGFAALSHQVLGLRADEGTWASIAPGATLVPILLWLSARGQPIVPALAVLILGVVIVTVGAEGAGRFGDARLPVESRIVAAQMGLLAACFVAFCTSALFAERRSTERRLRASEQQLAAIADTAPGVIFSLKQMPDGSLSFPFVSPTSAEVLGIASQSLIRTPSLLLDRLEPADRLALLAALADPESGDSVLSRELALRHGTAGESWIEMKARPVRDGDGRTIWHGFIQDVTIRRRSVDELGHRTRNLLSVVQSVAEYTARGTSPSELADTLGERLSGLAASHGLLAARGWEGADLDVLAKAQLAHLADLLGDRLRVTGPPLLLKPQAAQVIGMAIHELATNACKHGALSTKDGRVNLTWTAPDGDHDGRFRMEWREHGGKPFRKEQRQGFGSKVLVDMARYQLGASIQLEAGEEGIVWRLAAASNDIIRATDRSMAERRKGGLGPDDQAVGHG